MRKVLTEGKTLIVAYCKVDDCQNKEGKGRNKPHIFAGLSVENRTADNKPESEENQSEKDEEGKVPEKAKEKALHSTADRVKNNVAGNEAQERKDGE